jgi:hypothetical protein
VLVVVAVVVVAVLVLLVLLNFGIMLLKYDLTVQAYAICVIGHGGS